MVPKAGGQTIHIETDYLIVGGGASGLAFADTLVRETEATLTIVDRDHSPGGHWNHAYPFVRLHQPATFYGAASLPLGNNKVETDGPNKGMTELSSGAEIRAYFLELLEQRLLPTGRVRYLANAEVQEDGTIRSLLSGEVHTIDVRQKTVHAHLMGGSVPATHTPSFEIAPGACCVPVGKLAEIREPATQYVILGSGKTGIDACLWLLERGVPADRIAWVMPRDSWFLDRRFAQPTLAFYDFKLRNVLAEYKAVSKAICAADLFDRLEASGNLMRLDPGVRPTSYKCATVTVDELQRLRRIRNVVRKGYVRRIKPDHLDLSDGRFDLRPGAVCVDCTASAIPGSPARPVFDGAEINLQGLRTCQPMFSAALTAFVEASRSDDIEKARLCTPVPYPKEPMDWLRMTLISGQNQFAWMQEKDIRAWMADCRLDAFGGSENPVKKSTEQTELASQIKQLAFPAMVRLKQLIDEGGPT